MFRIMVLKFTDAGHTIDYHECQVEKIFPDPDIENPGTSDLEDLETFFEQGALIFSNCLLSQ